MSLRLNPNIEVLEPLLLMSATAIDGADADVAIEAVAAEATGFDAFSAFDEVNGEGLQAAESLFSEFGEQVGFEAQTFAADNDVADLSATVQPLQVEEANDGFDAGAEGFDAVDLNVIDLAEIDFGSVENSFGEAAESGLTVAVESPVPVVNLPPVAVHDYNFTVAGESVCGSVLCNDINPDGDSLTAWVSSSPENGSLCFQPDGTYTYTPNPDFCGLDVFVYVVTDGQGGCSSTSVTIEVGDPVEPVPVNTAPVAVDDSATTDFETSVSGNVLANDSDAEGDALQSWVEVGPENGSIELNPDGSFVYTPDPGFSGSDTFTYSVNDVEGSSTIATVTLEVGDAPVNTAPVAVDDSATTDFETSVSGNVLANDSDAEGDALQSWVEVGPENGSIELNPDGSFVYTPDPGFSGSDTFTYSVTDVEGNCTFATVTLEVGDAPVNTAPVAVDDSATTDFETSVSGNVLANDSDAEGDALQSWVEVGPENGSIELNPDGSFVYTPDPGFSGSDTFTYSVNDVEGSSTIATVTLEVGDAPVNTAPVAVDDSATTEFETSVSGNVLANDSDAEGDALESGIEDGPENGSLVLNSDGSFVYTPNPGFSGSDTFTYSVTDTEGNCTFATVTLEVGDPPVNEAPVAVDDSARGFTGQEISGSVLDNDYDSDGDGLSVAPVTDFLTSEGGTVSLKQDGTFVYQPADGYFGVDYFNYVLTDAAGNSATATVVVEVQPLPITVQDDSYSVVNNGGVITGIVTENDGPNSPDVIAQIVESPEFGTLVFAEDGSFEYQADAGFSGRDSFQYVLAHGCQTSEVATASLIVSNVQYDTTHESAGNGRVWGDPHFIGDDGGLYDVQGEAGKIYSLLSDQDLQVNALFIPWEIHPGSTMMGAIGVTSGTDQIVGDLTGTTVNGVVLEAGQTVQIEAGTVSYDGEFTTITTGEYELELHRRDGWYDMNLDSLDPFQDNVAPHGLWGLTVDADTEARDGDFFQNDGFDYTLQGGGAIDTVDENGQIVRTERGDRAAYNLYETAELLSVTALNSEADVLFRFAAEEGTGLSPI